MSRAGALLDTVFDRDPSSTLATTDLSGWSLAVGANLRLGP
jgi:hypothetical protein